MAQFKFNVRFFKWPFITRGFYGGDLAPLLRTMAAKFKFMTVENFGTSGKSRPEPWAPLSARYAKRVKRTIPTLELKGNLFRSLRVSEPSGNSISVFSDNAYSGAHQSGNPEKNLPRRAFFPIDRAGRATPYCRQVLENSIKRELESMIRKAV